MVCYYLNIQFQVQRVEVNIVDVKWWDMDCIDLADDRVLFHVLVTQQ